VPLRLDQIGVVVNRAPGVAAALRGASKVESLGYGAAWLTNGGSEDCMPLLAAIATTTTRLRLGTSVLQTLPRHPYTVATEANVIDQLAPGRLRLGVGPSHEAVMAPLGIHLEKPLTNMREYVTVLRSLLSTGEVAFDGEQYHVHASIGRAPAVPVMAGTLQPASFELAGAITDGAITWLCPAAYVRDVGIPSMTAGADSASRPRPPLVAHVAVCVHDDADEVRAAVRATIPNIMFPSYQRMLVAAGYSDASAGVWTDALIDRIIAWGSAARVAERVQEFFAAGADEILLRPVGAGAHPYAVIDRTLEAIAERS